MEVERELIISILRLTKNGLASRELICKTAKVSSQIVEKVLKELYGDGLIRLKEGFVEADGLQRLKLAIKSISMGADVERVSGLLKWQEFENMASIILTQNNYAVEKGLRFKYAGRRWEIDIIGCKKPIILCFDCKHWGRGLYPSALKKVVEGHVMRAHALFKSLQNLPGELKHASWDEIILIPAILSLAVGRFKFYDGVPIVPIIQLQDFLTQLPAYVNLLKHFTKVSPPAQRPFRGLDLERPS